MTQFPDPEEPSIAEQKAKEMKAIADSFDEKIADLEAKSKSAKARYESTRPEEVRSGAPRQSTSSYRGLGFGLMLAYGLIGVPIVCYGIGILLDQRTGGRQYQSWLTVFGATAATAWAIWILQRHQKD